MQHDFEEVGYTVCVRVDVFEDGRMEPVEGTRPAADFGIVRHAVAVGFGSRVDRSGGAVAHEQRLHRVADLIDPAGESDRVLAAVHERFVGIEGIRA